MLKLNRQIRYAICLSVCIAQLGIIACSSDEPETAATQTPAVSVTPLPPDPVAAQEVFRNFVDVVVAGDVPKAWALYTASIPGTIKDHREDMGCEFTVFQVEFPGLQHLFARTAPFEVKEFFGTSVGSVQIELRLRAANDTEFLATLLRVSPTEPYRLRFLNSGQVSAMPGAPDPLPSPEDPQGYCGIWTGGR